VSFYDVSLTSSGIARLRTSSLSSRVFMADVIPVPFGLGSARVARAGSALQRGRPGGWVQAHFDSLAEGGSKS